jgi:hypothetical protein
VESRPQHHFQTFDACLKADVAATGPTALRMWAEVVETNAFGGSTTADHVLNFSFRSYGLLPLRS